MDRLMQEGGIADSGISKEPVTGNEIPPGSMASEVRDDIPTQLSEGEYVVPADVVRFFGVRFFEDLRAKAKQGLSQMDADGRIGGAPVDASGIPMQDEEDQLSPEEEQMLTEALGSTGMAFGGMVGQMPFNMQGQPPSNPYKDQSTMYNMPVGMAEGGDLGFDRTQFQINPSSSYGIESRKYINPNTGEIRYFNFMEGNQLGIIPEGFVAWTAELQQTAQDTGAATTDEASKPAVRTRTNTSVTPASVNAEADNEGGTANYESWADKNYEEITSNPYQFGIDALNKTKGKGLAKGLAGVGLMAGSPLLTAAGGVLNLSNKINNIASANAALKVMESQGLTGTTEYKNLESSIKSAASDIPLANWGFVGQGENYYQAVVKKAATPVTAPVRRPTESAAAPPADAPADAPAKATTTRSSSSGTRASGSGGGAAQSGQAAVGQSRSTSGSGGGAAQSGVSANTITQSGSTSGSGGGAAQSGGGTKTTTIIPPVKTYNSGTLPLTSSRAQARGGLVTKRTKK